jgi:hypothetical protein
MEQIKYFQATENDLETLIDFRILFSDELVGKQDEQIENRLRDSLQHYFSTELNRSYFCWFATVNGVVAGIGGMCLRAQPGNVKNISGTWGYIVSMYCKPEHRRIGSTIVNRLVDTGRTLGITAFELHATNAGEKVYQKQGFVMHDEPTYRKWI